MTVARFLGIYYRHASRFERWLSGKPLTHAEQIELQKQEERDG